MRADAITVGMTIVLRDTTTRVIVTAAFVSFADQIRIEWMNDDKPAYMLYAPDENITVI